MTPMIGDTVWYKPGPHQAAQWSAQAPGLHFGDIVAAVVVGVVRNVQPFAVNLRIMLDGTGPLPRVNGVVEGDDFKQWSWPIRRDAPDAD